MEKFREKEAKKNIGVVINPDTFVMTDDECKVPGILEKYKKYRNSDGYGKVTIISDDVVIEEDHSDNKVEDHSVDSHENQDDSGDVIL